MLDFIVDHLPARARPAGEFKWTVENVGRLKTLWKHGLSAEQIAVEISAPSRGAVLGKIRRLGLQRRLTPPKVNWRDHGKVERLRTMWSEGYMVHEIAEEFGVSVATIERRIRYLGLGYRRRSLANIQRKAAMGQRIAKGVAKPPPAVAKRLTAVNDHDIPLSQRKSFFELENHHCRYPIGEPGVDLFFCGHPSADLLGRRPYCRWHKKLTRGQSQAPTGRGFRLYGS